MHCTFHLNKSLMMMINLFGFGLYLLVCISESCWRHYITFPSSFPSRGNPFLSHQHTIQPCWFPLANPTSRTTHFLPTKTLPANITLPPKVSLFVSSRMEQGIWTFLPRTLNLPLPALWIGIVRSVDGRFGYSTLLVLKPTFLSPSSPSKIE